MRFFAYRGKQANFGDELNHWLWDRLLPGFFDEDDSELFLGIGSILYDHFDPDARKTVFGSGYGGYGAAPTIDRNWHVYFVRGKQTARALGIDLALGIGDAGILVRSCWDASGIEKRHAVSFMPHFESAMYGNWQQVCDRAGVNLIDPRRDVEEILREISASHLVVSEAMHGVIIADALRVPWRAIRPLDPANRTKWYDWASALDVSIEFTDLGPSNIVEAARGWLRWNEPLRRQVVFRHRRIRQLTRDHAFTGAVRRLREASKLAGQLSSDAAIDVAHSAMLSKLDELKAEFDPGRSIRAGRVPARRRTPRSSEPASP
jgi:exopolysaccharide glucosyl ketal-pyruvate-transferase